MTQTIQTVRAKIERLVRRDPVMGASAEFFLAGSTWLCCTAYILREDMPNPGRVACRGTPMTMEQAAIVGVALQMAIDWIAEEYFSLQESSQ